MTANSPSPQAVGLRERPFCGGTDLSVSTYDVQPDDYHLGYVTCSDCDAEGARPDGWLGDKPEAHDAAIAAWNRRASPADGVVVPVRIAEIAFEAMRAEGHDRSAAEINALIQRHLAVSPALAATSVGEDGEQWAHLRHKCCGQHPEDGHAPGCDRTIAKSAEGEGPEPAMSEREVQQWIDTCNPEPARRVLRDYLSFRSTTPDTDKLLIAREGLTCAMVFVEWVLEWEKIESDAPIMAGVQIARQALARLSTTEAGG